jgi:hypothetical protein
MRRFLCFIDVIFNSGSGLCIVGDAWFARSLTCIILDTPVRIAPLERIFWQKAYRGRTRLATRFKSLIKAFEICKRSRLQRPGKALANRGTRRADFARISQMESSETLRVKEDLKSQAYEGCRKILASVSNMIASPSPWQRDAFYGETMRHLAMLQQQLGQWRLKVARIQSEAIRSDGEGLDRPA